MVAVPSIIANNVAAQRPGVISATGSDGLFSEVFIAAQTSSMATQNVYSAPNQETFNVMPATVIGRFNLNNSGQNAATNPLLSFFQQLREQNLQGDSLLLNPESQTKLEELLLNSGYGSQEIEELFKLSRQSDGSLNLLALGQTVLMNPPLGGQAFNLKQEDRPLFAQAMQELGIASNEVENYLNSAPRQDNQYLLRDIAGLLAQARINPQVGEDGLVDKTKVQNLLQKLGLSKQEIDVLLSSNLNSNSQGANAREMFSLLQAAAQKQDQGVAQALHDLAQRSQQTTQDEGQSDAQRLQAHMIRALQKIEARTAIQADPEAPVAQKEQVAAAKPESASQAEGKLSDTVKAVLESAAKTQNSELGQHKGRNSEQEKGNPHAKEQADQTRLVSNEAQNAAKANAKENPFSAIMGNSEAASVKAAGAGSSLNLLPAYVVRQVAFNMAQMANRGQNSLRMELKPPTLGEISMELSVKDGAIKASMVAQTVAAKQALEAGMEQLKQQLAQQGLRLEQIDISVNPDAQKRHERTAEESGQRNNQRRASGAMAEPVAEGLSARPATGQLSVMA